MARLSNQNIQEIISLYQSGMSPKDIGEKFGIYNNSVTRILRKKGIERNQAAEKVNEENVKYIIEQYKNGKSTIELSKELNIADSTVSRILNRNKVDIRPLEVSTRTFKINDSFFETIDSEEKAYFLGLLYADGSLSKKQYSCKIVLQERDAAIVEKFSNIFYGFTKTYKDIREFDTFTRTYIGSEVYSKKIHGDLCKLGCPPNKTFKIVFPKNDIVPDNLIHHFIRGYFDGDGCISIDKTSLHAVVEITSNVDFITGIHSYLNSNVRQNMVNKVTINKKNSQTASITITGYEDIYCFYNFIYKDAANFLQRKYDKFQDFLKDQEDKINALKIRDNTN